jgi:hypothetical protein
MSSSKKLCCKEYFAAGVYLTEAQNPISPTVYVYTVYLFTQGSRERGRVEPERRGEVNSSQSCVENSSN